MKRCALYARVSTKQKTQNPETQLMQLREYAQNRGLDVYDEYVDVGISGSKDRRPQLDKLMKDSRNRKFDAVIVFRFDRFARSTRHLVTALEEFQTLGVHFISLSEAIDTSTPMGKMVFTVIGAVAELERDIIRERVIAGLERARRQNKQLGRPRRVFDRNKAVSLRRKGKSIREIAIALGVGKDAIHSAIRSPVE
jgi:DNA invertase Pin-like site-specific DNA recombinase